MDGHRMLNELGIENFKAFADGGARVSFRPLTLVYGANNVARGRKHGKRGRNPA